LVGSEGGGGGVLKFLDDIVLLSVLYVLLGTGTEWSVPLLLGLMLLLLELLSSGAKLVFNG